MPSDRGRHSHYFFLVFPVAGKGVSADSLAFAPGTLSLGVAQTGNDGSYSAPFTAPAVAGSYQLTACYAGSNVLLPAQATVTFAEPSHSSFFNGETALSSAIYYLQLPGGNLFGYYTYLSNTIIYHFDMGYEGIVDAPPGAAYRATTLPTRVTSRI